MPFLQAKGIFEHKLAIEEVTQKESRAPDMISMTIKSEDHWERHQFYGDENEHLTVEKDLIKVHYNSILCLLVTSASLHILDHRDTFGETEIGRKNKGWRLSARIHYRLLPRLSLVQEYWQ